MVYWSICLVLFPAVTLGNIEMIRENQTASNFAEKVFGDGDLEYENETSIFDNAVLLYPDFESQMAFTHVLICNSRCNNSALDHLPLQGKEICSRCYCDHLCHVYDDCCPDILFVNSSTIMPSEFPASLEEIKELSHEKGLLNCESSSVSMFDVQYTIHYRMVNYCPPIHFSDRSFGRFGPLSQRTKNSDLTEEQHSMAAWQALEAKCKNTENSTHWNFTRPVTSSSGVVFRNEYCAQCHGQQAANLTKWNVAMQCKEARELLAFSSATEAYNAAVNSLTKSCEVHFLYDNENHLHSCTPKASPFISYCNKTGLWETYDHRMDRACDSYTNVFLRQYKNPFCFYCNVDVTSQNNEIITKSNSHGDVARVSFYALLAFDGDDANSKRVISQEEKCKEGTLLDPSTCQCRAVRCGRFSVFNGNNCTSYIVSSNYYGFDVCSRFRFTSETPITSVPCINDKLALQMARPFQFKDIKVIPRLDCNDSTALTLDVKSRADSFDISDLQAIAQMIVSANHKVAQSWSSDPPMNVTVLVPASNCLEESEWLNSIPDHCSTKNRTRSLKVLKSNVMELRNHPRTMIYFLLQNTSFCPHVNLTTAEYRDYSAKLHEIGLSERNIASDLVIEKNETFYLVCVKDYRRILSLSTCQTKIQVPSSVSFQDSRTTLGLVSVICTCISLLSLLCVIVTYSLLRPLRTTMGTSTLSMACLLFLAQILYEVGIEQFEIYEVCLLLAVLIHLFWLAAVFMMSSCTLQFFYSVVFPLQARAFLASKVLKRSLSCSFGLSIVIISLVMLGNQLMYGDLGYPHRYLCFIRRSLFRQLGFGLPLGLAVVLNIVIFIITTIYVRRLPNISCTQENKVSLMACFRLSVITGLTWLSLFLLSVPGTRPWLEYVSVLLLGLQGLLLATTLLINKRVFSLWTDFFHHRNKGSQSAATCSDIQSVSNGRIPGNGNSLQQDSDP